MMPLDHYETAEAYLADAGQQTLGSATYVALVETAKVHALLALAAQGLHSAGRR